MSGPLAAAERVVRLDAWFAPDRDLALQAYPGSAWRGAFGHALKRAICVMRLQPCADCALREVCLFPRLFVPIGSAGEGRQTNTPPVPFILAPEAMPKGGIASAGTTLAVRFTLLPPATDHAIYALRALIDAAERGIGPARVPLTLTAIAPAGAPPQPPSDEAIAVALAPRVLAPPPAPAGPVPVRLLTPLRVRLAGDLLTGRHFMPHHLLAAALRRVAGLFGSPDPAVVRPLLDAARALAWAEPRFGWLETVRRSTRQQATMRLGGIVGEAHLSLAAAPGLWPLLWWASVLHVGKGASMGFGRVTLDGTGTR
jgi:hypothetical protein